jgi:M6 family metalloprotease-like protein
MKIVAVLSFLWVMLFSFRAQIFSSTQSVPDSLNILAIRIQFQPDSAETTTGDGTFDLSVSNDPFQIDPPPHNKSYFQDHLSFIQNYFKKVSSGEFTIFGDVFPSGENDSYQLDHEMTYYNPNTTPDEINTRLAELFRDAILKADEDPEIIFSNYNAYVIFHAGVGKDVDLGFDDTPQDIPSLFITSEFLEQYLGITGIPVDDGSTSANEGSILPETESQAGIELGLNGIITSNVGSQLGWLDLFSPVTRRSGVGRFSVMDAGLFNGDGLLPALPDAWTRIDAGWETSIPIVQAQNDEFMIYHVLSAKQGRVYKFPINENEYFLVENRYSGQISLDSLQFESGFETSMKEILLTHLPAAVTFSERGVLIDVDNPDRGLPGSGCLIWHIDENVIASKRNANRINEDPDHRGVDVEEADGSQDIGQAFDVLSGGAGSEIGTALDLWYQENNAPLFQENPANEFSIESIPNSRSYYNRANSHVKIFNFSSRDSSMTFEASVNFFQQYFPVNVQPEKYGQINSLKVSDIDRNGEEDLIFTTNVNKILTMSKLGEGAWSDSIEIGEIAGEIIPYPAIYTLPDGTKGLVALSSGGSVNLFEFDLSFRPAVRAMTDFFQCPDSITTFPIAEHDWLTIATVPGNIQLDSIPKIYWGCRDGDVYEMVYENGNWQQPTVYFLVGEPVSKIHFATGKNLVVISNAGNVFSQGGDDAKINGKFFQPSGYQPVTVNDEGFFFELHGQNFDHPEDGIHAFNSGPIAVASNSSESETLYLVAGNNRLNIFNYNFTLIQNFPVQLFNPDISLSLNISPLVGSFPSLSNENAPGAIVVDPSGGISGYDLDGKSLPDFPLAIGNTIFVSPAILDIDGDNDVELACVSGSGTVYVWDFTSSIDSERSFQYWTQAYANEMNQNRYPSEFDINSGTDSNSQSNELMPANRAYNWPNPNIDNYTFIRYRLNEEANVKIKIFDLAGDLVKEMEGTGNSNSDNEVRWELSNVQSGVYIARIEAAGQSRTETRIIKIAVVK